MTFIGAYRFEHPCRCGDRFTVAEAVRLPSCQVLQPYVG